ncbi:MAG: hypothetical protein HC887_08725 [Desulfobacteraceae bacterium]|nr:hypothetical protein [Desulfobacteraceae bacterium]
MTSLVIVAGFWVVPGFVLDYMIFTGACLLIVVSGRIWQHHEGFVRRLPRIHILSAVLLIPTLFSVITVPCLL